MSKIFYIADTHFGHGNIITYDNRPFTDTEDMTEAIIENWNSVVKNDDDVYVVGDMFWKLTWDEADAIAVQLNGLIHCIKGNHDETNVFPEDAEQEFGYKEIIDEGRHVVLCHYPIMFYNNMVNPNWYHLYGHVHAAWDHNMTESWRKQIESLYLKEWQGYNVGCMMPYMNYTPRTLDEIVAGARKMRGEN